MKKIFNALLIACLISIGSVQAQLQKLTIEDAVLRQRTTLAPKRLPQLQWIPGSASFSYVDTKNNAEVLVQGSVGNTETTDVLSLSKLNALLTSSKMDTLPKIPAMKWKNASTISFSLKKKQFELSTKDMKLALMDSITLPESAEVESKSDKGDIAYVSEFNIYIEKNHQAKQITSDGTNNIVYGKSVHREEFGIEKGLFWSPQGNKLAFYRMDQSMVNDYPIVDFSATPAKEKIIKYPMAGGVSHEVTVGIYDLSSGKIVYLKTGLPADQYLTNIAWSPDEKSVFIAVLNRDQNHMKLNQYNAATGDFIKTLFEEKDDKYTEPLHPIEFIPGNNNQFIWQSRRDGFYHLYLYEVSGNLIKQLTKGEWEVSDFTGFDAKGKFAYFHATGNNGVDRDFYRVELNSGSLTKISTGSGVHVCVANDDKKYFMDTYSNRFYSSNYSSGR
ncbi:MAG: DPP IV N-terminal domain-containing protein [Bacteroidetes bacterium]|nr:DPP IV N-terminal domain-containing protein [Bacteroidota bacterium]